MYVALQVEQPLGQHHPDVPPLEVDRGDEILDGGDKTLALAEVYAEEGVGVAVVIVGHDAVMSIGLDGETYEILHVEFVILLRVYGYAQLAAYKLLGTARRIQIVEADDGTRGAAPFEGGAPQRHVERVDLDEEGILCGVEILGEGVVEGENDASAVAAAEEFGDAGHALERASRMRCHVAVVILIHGTGLGLFQHI